MEGGVTVVVSPSSLLEYLIICHNHVVFMSLNLLIINLLSIMSIFKPFDSYK